MKKLVIGIGIIVVVVIAAAPFVSGLMMEKIVTEQQKSYAERYADQPFYPQIQIVNYQRGYLSSQVEWSIQLPENEPFTDIGPIILSETAQHGLIGVTTQVSLTKNRWYNDFINEQLAGKDPFSLTGEYSIFSGVTARFVNAAFQIPLEDNSSLEVKAGHITFNSDASLENIKTSANFAGLALSDLVNIDGIALESDNNVITGMIMAGTGQVTIDRIALNNPDNGKNIAIDRIKVMSDINYDAAQDSLSAVADYSADQIVAAGTEIKDVHVGFAINNLDAAGVNDFYRVYSEILNAAMEDMSSAQSDPQQAQLLLQEKFESARMRLVSELEKLLTKDLQVKISDVNVVFPQGKVTGDLAIGLKKDMTLMNFMVLLQQPQAVTDIFSFESHASVAQELVPNAERFIYPLMPAMQSGVFEVSGQQLVHHAEIKGDKFLLNGEEILFENL